MTRVQWFLDSDEAHSLVLHTKRAWLIRFRRWNIYLGHETFLSFRQIDKKFRIL